MTRKISILTFITAGIIIVLNCKKINNDNDKIIEKKTPVKRAMHEYGDLTLTVDPSFKNLAQSIANTYMIDYPDVKIKINEKIEEKAIKDFYEGKIPLLMVGKTLTNEQQEYLFNKTKINYIASPIALDATIFITSIDNPISSISLDDIINNLYNTNPSISFIFDHPNSANFNTVNNKLKLSVTKNSKVISMGTTEKVLDYVEKYKKTIGIIGLNILSNKGNPKVQNYLKKIKILAIKKHNNEIVEPTNPNLRNGSYPFYRKIYLLKNEKGFGIGAGYSRLTGSQRGQKIITRENLQPYYLYKRTVKINVETPKN